MVDYAIKDLKNGVLEMTAAIQKLCETSSLPFKKTKASDELKFVPILPKYINSFRQDIHNLSY